MPISVQTKNKSSIALLGSRGIPARYGGFETFAQEIGVRLAERGYDVTVYCERKADGSSPQSHRGVNLVYMRAPRLGPLSTIVFDVQCLWNARKGFETVYMLGYGTALFCVIPRIWRRRVWINMDGLEWARSKWNAVAKIWLKMMEASALLTATRIIADAEAIRTNLQSRYNKMPRCSVIAYGADVVKESPSIEQLDTWQLKPDAYYLVVCRLEPENHVAEIISGFCASKSTVELVIVGDHHVPGSYAAELRGNGDARVRFAGTVFDQSALQALRWHCRAYFHGHSVGGTNPSLIEAMGCGNRIIAHDNPFNREVAGDCAVYFSSADSIPEIVTAIDRQVQPHSRDDVQQRVQAIYNWDRIADQYEALLQQPVD